MSYSPPRPRADEDLFYDRKAGAERGDDFPADMSEHKDLFETISEAHYLPELDGPHDEELLESLVEKGCEDNQVVVGQALDKLAQLVGDAPEYAEEEDELLLAGAPVADIIDRLEHTLRSPGRSSISAAHGLLHLHEYVAERAPEAARTPPSLPSEDTAPEAAYTVSVPDSNETYLDKPYEEPPAPSIPDPTEVTSPPEETEPQPEPAPRRVAPVCEQSEAHSNTGEEHDERPASVKREDVPTNDETMPTDLSVQNLDSVTSPLLLSHSEVMNFEDNASEKSDEQPKDLSVHKRAESPGASPRRAEPARAPSRESDAMQSPQPSGIPAVPSSPELFTVPLAKSKQTLFLETLLSSPSPKMYTSEVTISKQQCEPLNLGKHRKSASPTVSSCSDEIRKQKEFSEPPEKRQRRDSLDDLAKVNKVFGKCSEDSAAKRADRPSGRAVDANSPLQQFNILKSRADYTLPDPLLIPKDKLETILSAPAREIPALLIQRPELRLPATFAFPAILQDPDILVVSLAQLERVLADREARPLASPRARSAAEPRVHSSRADREPRPIPSMDALAGDIDAATSAALNQMLWLPYLSRLEAMAACSPGVDFVKAFGSSAYGAPSYAEPQLFSPAGRFLPALPAAHDYEQRLQFAMWQEAMAHASAPRSKAPPAPEHGRDAGKAGDVQNPYVHSTKGPGKGGAARGWGGGSGGAGRGGARAGEAPRPRISVKSLHNLLEPGAGEVCSSTPPAPDPAAFHLWHPLFGNQKSYNSPWSWTTVTATGD